MSQSRQVDEDWVRGFGELFAPLHTLLVRAKLEGFSDSQAFELVRQAFQLILDTSMAELARATAQSSGRATR